MTRKAIILVVFMGCLVLGGCNKRPEGVLSEKEMVDLMTDMQLMQAYQNTSISGPGHPDRESLVDAVLAKHGVTPEELDSTIAYYGRNMDEYYQMYQKVEKNLRTIGGKTEDSVSEEDLWPFNHFAAFLPGQLSDGLTFSLPIEEIGPGDALEWRMRLTSPEGVEILLGVEYENGNSSIVKKNGGGNNSLSIKLITDTAYGVKRVFGTMTAPRTTLPLWADSIKLLKKDFDSLEYIKIRSQKLIYPPHIKPVNITEADSSSVKDMKRPIVP